MKKIFRFVGLIGLLTVMLAAGAVASFAQDPCADVDGINGLYNDVLQNYKSTDPAVLQKAVDSAKQFLEKYGSCDVAKVQTDWMKPKVPAWEENIKTITKTNKLTVLYKRFNDSFTAKNFDDVYASGKEILALEPENIDAILVLGSIGLDESLKKNNKYNDDTVKYAKLAIDKLNAGVTSKTFGIFIYGYKTKENALGWMNLSIGYIKFEPMNDKKGALPYLYQATQFGPETKANPLPFSLIGKYFRLEAEALTADLKTLVASQPPATAADDVKAKFEADYKEKLGLFNGTLERSLDAYSRAYSVAKPADKDGIFQSIKALYSVRFQKETGINEYIASTTAKPLADPTSPVTPVIDPEVKPDAAKTGSTATPSANGAKTTAATASKAKTP